MLSLKAELAELKQKLELQQSQLEAVPDLKSQLSHLARQLEAERGAAHDKEAALAQEQLVSSGSGDLVSTVLGLSS